jgi:hypothetical protein
MSDIGYKRSYSAILFIIHVSMATIVCRYPMSLYMIVEWSLLNNWLIVLTMIYNAYVTGNPIATIGKTMRI